MEAIDVQCFAGGFTLGVADAGFDVVAKRELPGGFGVESVDLNRGLINPNLDIEVGQGSSWTPRSGVAFVFGNPPCSGFSQVSDKKTHAGRDKINACMWELVRYAASMAPPVVAFESVQGAYRNGRDLMRDLRAELEELTGARYDLFHVLHDAQLLGGAAQRRRYFWVASRIPIGFGVPDVEWVENDKRGLDLVHTIGDLRGLANTATLQPYVVAGDDLHPWARAKRAPDGHVDGHVFNDDPQYAPGSTALLEVGWRQGTDFVAEYRHQMAELGRHPVNADAHPEWAERFERIHNGSWQPKRWAWDRPAYVVTGNAIDRAVHPDEPRCLSLRELFRIQGFPDAWRLERLIDEVGFRNASLFPGKGIPVESGRWLARCVRAALEGAPVDDGSLTQVGDREYLWKKNGHAKRRSAIKGKTSKPRVASGRKERTMAKTQTEDELARQLKERGYAFVALTGEADSDKKEKERLYSAAYGMDAKVAVRQDKKRGFAVGVFRPDGGDPVMDPNEAKELAWTAIQNGEAPEPVSAGTPEANGAQSATSSADAIQAPPQDGPDTIIIPFEGFGDAGPGPYEDGTLHTPGGTGDQHFIYSLAANAWSPVVIPDPPDDPGVWGFDPDSFGWIALEPVPSEPEPEPEPAPAPAAPIPPPAPRNHIENRTIECPGDGCQAQVIIDRDRVEANEDANGRTVFTVLCWSCRARVDAATGEVLVPGKPQGGAMTQTAPEKPAAPEPLPVTEDENETVHDIDDDDDDGGEEELEGNEEGVDQTVPTWQQDKNSARETDLGREYDQTQLRARTHGYYVHRDYAAHYFRWGWAGRHFTGSKVKALEVGCGQDVPLARVGAYSNRFPSELVAVDLNPITDPPNRKWLTLYDEFNFNERYNELLEKHGKFEVIINFEVIEHMTPAHGDTMLAGFKALLEDDGYVLVSTPVFNGKAAANHIHEYEVDELREKFERAGFQVVNRWGTFASYHDVKRGVEAWFDERCKAAGIDMGDAAADLVLAFYEDLRAYYGDDVLACFMAPNLPDHSRNNVWQLKHA